MEAETSKTTTCTRLIFDRGGHGPYYTRPMAAGLPDLVDCARLAEEAAVLERVYELGECPACRIAGGAAGYSRREICICDIGVGARAARR